MTPIRQLFRDFNAGDVHPVDPYVQMRKLGIAGTFLSATLYGRVRRHLARVGQRRTRDFILNNVQRSR